MAQTFAADPDVAEDMARDMADAKRAAKAGIAPGGRLAALIRWGRAFGEGAANLLLPAVCILCRAPVDTHGELCGSCWAGIDFISAPYCDRLGIPLPFDTGEAMVSAAALASPPSYDRARAVAHYASTMRALIQGFKYRDRHEGLALFARWMAHAGEALLGDADLIVPVPLNRTRLWSRRFNQAALLAGRLGRLTGVPVAHHALRRVKRTSRQVGLSATQRRRNVAGAFRVADKDKGDIAGKAVVLVDDVITTGATAEACARALRRAGAARVDVLVLARVVEPGAFSL